jgi:hypothetical protein
MNALGFYVFLIILNIMIWLPGWIAKKDKHQICKERTKTTKEYNKCIEEIK